jgi:hypothetical protein
VLVLQMVLLLQQRRAVLHTVWWHRLVVWWWLMFEGCAGHRRDFSGAQNKAHSMALHVVGCM